MAPIQTKLKQSANISHIHDLLMVVQKWFDDGSSLSCMVDSTPCAFGYMADFLRFVDVEGNT